MVSFVCTCLFIRLVAPLMLDFRGFSLSTLGFLGSLLGVSSPIDIIRWQWVVGSCVNLWQWRCGVLEAILGFAFLDCAGIGL